MYMRVCGRIKKIWVYDMYVFSANVFKPLFRGTQRLFSVKYLFGQANIALNFLLLEDS